jgi:hypothetical protein
MKNATINKLPLLLITILLLGCSHNRQTSDLEQVFSNPPESTKPWCYWYWLNDNISKEGITKDLEAMAKVGIGEAFIGNILDETIVTRGNVKVLTNEWWAMVEHAIREADRLGIKVGLFNCPGWSQSGGPWVKPEQAMRYIVSSELIVKGPKTFSGKLPIPKTPFQQVSVQAFPLNQEEKKGIFSLSPKVFTSPALKGANNLFDGNVQTTFNLQGYPLIVDVELEKPITVRNMQIYPQGGPLSAICDLQIPDKEGSFHTIATCDIDRENLEVHVGPMVFGPLAESFPAVTSKKFRLVFNKREQSNLPFSKDNNSQSLGQIGEISLSGSARLSHYVEKQMGKMNPTPNIAYDSYKWDKPAEPGEPGLVLSQDQIIDLTSKVSEDGTLTWEVPEGEWIILRTGMTPTGTENAPVAEEGRGYEVDKMNKEAVIAHFDAYAGKILAMIPPKERNGIRHIVADSYEQGSENWTEGFAETFKEAYGYDPVVWLPVLTGRIIESADRSNRFLWDLRRLVADLIPSNYVAGLREKCEQNGIRLWLENYGHWGFPGEFLNYGGASDDLGGEFWLDGLGAVETRCASSAAHIYGKNVVSAEAFTSIYAFRQTPKTIKARGDWAFTQGINHFVFHVNIHQPWDDRLPGMNAWFGTDFNRNSTWFFKGKAYIDYVRRSHALLQQGNNVADIAYFIGDDTPKMTGEQNPKRPLGYNYDYINGDVIRNDAQVKDGRIVLSCGTSYRILVLPNETTMRPELLSKLMQLVRDGATIIGRSPKLSPSMKNYPSCDEQVKKMAKELWGNCDGIKQTENVFGKGRVFCGISLEEAFDRMGILPDVDCPVNYLWTHRQKGSTEIYFVTNQSDKLCKDTLSFRVTGMQPELWDAVSGEFRNLPQFREKDGHTKIPLEFSGADSWFIVFRKKASGQRSKEEVNFPAPKPVIELTGEWNLQFNPKFGAPADTMINKLFEWTTDKNTTVKYYSGTATYRKEFIFNPLENVNYLIDLGEVESLATVKLNGQELATLWRLPYRTDITGALKNGTNLLEVEVVNTWWNRVVGDARSETTPYTWAATTVSWNAKSELLPAGLLGPVKILTKEN